MEKDIELVKSKVDFYLVKIHELEKELEGQQDNKLQDEKKYQMGVIDLLDVFEDVEDGILERFDTTEGNVGKVMQRYGSVKRKLLYLLSECNVTKIEFPAKRPIDNYSIIRKTELDPTQEDGTIIFINLNGYKQGDKIIRKAELTVVKN